MTAQLRRTLGPSAAVTVGLGAMVGAGVFAVWGPAAAAAGSWLLPALAVAAVVAVCNALSSAALAVRYSSAGGAYVYGRERLGPRWGFLAGWCFVIGKTASCAAMAMTVGSYLVPGAERVAAVGAVLAVTALNLAGVQRSVTASRVIVTVVVAALLGVGLAALWPGRELVTAEHLAPTGTPDLLGVLQAAGLLFFAFAGYARIATLAEEVREPERVIPRAVVTALALVLVLYLLVGALVLAVLGPQGTALSVAPLAEVGALAWGSGAAWVVRVVAGLAALGALLNLVLGISRTAIAMARDGHLPGGLTRLSGPGSVPRVAELCVGAAVLLVVLTLDLRGAIGFSSAGVLLYYAVANAAAWTLGPGQGLPRVVPVVGFLGCVVLVAALPTASVLGGLTLVLAGVAAYFLRRRAAARPMP